MALTVIQKIRPFIHPRLLFFTQNPLTRLLSALVIFVMGLFLALPLPIPFSNLTAAWAIFLMALGLLEDDGLLIILSYLVAMATFFVFSGVFILLKQLFLG